MKVLIEANEFVTPESPDHLDMMLRTAYSLFTPSYIYNGMLENDVGDIIIDVEFPHEEGVAIYGLMNVIALDLYGTVLRYPDDIFTYTFLDENDDVMFMGSFFGPEVDLQENPERCPVCGEDPNNCPFES